MNSQQLIVFHEVMKTGSVSQAARNLHRTQPAISASIKALEGELGLALFLREGRRMVPVPEAHYLMDEATDILSRLETAQHNLSHMRDRMRGSLRIVAMPGASSFLLPQFISRFVEDSPDVRVTLATRSSPQIRSLVAAQNFDIGFCDMSRMANDRELYQSDEIPGTCLCAVAADHPLAQQDQVTAKDLDGLPMGALQPEHATYRETARAFAISDAVFNVTVDAQYFLPLIHFIESGQICSVMDVMSAESYRQSSRDPERIRFLPFAPVVPFGYSLLTPNQRPLSRLAQGFVSAWRGYVAATIESLSPPQP